VTDRRRGHSAAARYSIRVALARQRTICARRTTAAGCARTKALNSSRPASLITNAGLLGKTAKH
jgi:hypothetical protein